MPVPFIVVADLLLTAFILGLFFYFHLFLTLRFGFVADVVSGTDTGSQNTVADPV